MKLCECGCGLPTRPAPGTDASKGWKKGVWLRYRRYHEGRGPIINRLERKTTKKDNGCWIWTGLLWNGMGYGCLSIDGKVQGVHRWSWEEFKGPIPEGMQVLHRCDTPACWNPDHLFIGTHADNMRDKTEKGRAAQKLTKADALRIKELVTSGLPQRLIAAEFNVSRATVGDISSDRRWKHMDN